VAGEACGRKGSSMGIKGAAQWGGRVYPIRTPPRSIVAPIADPLSPLVTGVDGSAIARSSTPPLAPPLGVLL
jgi:hypothetical protein